MILVLLSHAACSRATWLSVGEQCHESHIYCLELPSRHAGSHELACETHERHESAALHRGRVHQEVETLEGNMRTGSAHSGSVANFLAICCNTASCVIWSYLHIAWGAIGAYSHSPDMHLMGRSWHCVLMPDMTS